MSALDPRLNAFRPDLADLRLKDRVEAAAYAAGESARITAPLVDVMRRPDAASGRDTQFLCGEEVLVFERAQSWTWLQGARDGYVGYVPETALGPAAAEPNAVIGANTTFVYDGPDLKNRVAGTLTLGARVATDGEAETRGTRYARLAGGGERYVVAAHLRAPDAHEIDFVAVAERMLHAPYLWGGLSPLGLDCSGLIQLAMLMCGRSVLRDTPMQAATIGDPVDPGGGWRGLQRGDLVFWNGHVGIMRDDATLLHASGATMTVTLEPLADAIARIAPLFGEPTLCRRP